MHRDTKGFLITPPTHTHTHLSIHRQKKNKKTQDHNIQAETNTDGYNYEKRDVLHNYRLLICDRRPHSRNDRSETSIYYGGFGLIFLQIFKTPTTVRGLKTFPLFGCGGGSRRRLRILVLQHSSWTRAFPSSPSQSFIHTHTV